MKIIDLLNKISNGEEVPKKIKYDNSIYEYIRMWEQYVHETSETPLLKEISAYNYSGLNNEVEILEKEKKIPEKLTILQYSDLIDLTQEGLIEVVKKQNFKINEIIDFLKRNGE